MPRELIDADGLSPSVPYHYLAAAPAGSLVFSAGACPLDAGGAVVAPGDLLSQTRQALANLARALEAAGCGPDDVVKTTVYVATGDRRELTAVWDAYTAMFGTDGPPSTLLGVTVLGWPDQLVEIEAVAVSSACGCARRPR